MSSSFAVKTDLPGIAVSLRSTTRTVNCCGSLQFPASTAVEATLLIDGMLVEIDAVAARGAVRRTQ